VVTKANSVRVNIWVSKDLKEWFQSYAEKCGMSMSSLMAFALFQFREKEEGKRMLESLERVIAKVEKMSKEELESLKSEI